MTLKNRLLEFINYLEIPVSRFEKSCNLSNGYIRKLKGNIGEDKLVGILDSYPQLNKVWLLTGEGSMLNTSLSESSARLVGSVFAASYGDDEVTQVDFVPVASYASFVEVCGSGDENYEKMGAILSSEERRIVGKLRIFEVDGESMYPTIKSGSYILTEEVPMQRWHNINGVAVVIYNETVTIKRIKKNRLESENYIILSADNEEYGEKIVQLADIRAIFKARRIISAPID